MPTTGANGSKISWATNNEEFIASNGQVTRPAYSAGDVVVALTATLTKGAAKVTKTFDVIVKAALPTANELLAEAKQKLEEKITNINNLIENTKETLENANENAKEEIENKLADLNSLLETTKALLEQANSNNSQEIEDKINEAQNNMQEAVKKLASDLQNAEQELANAVASGDAAIEEKIEELKALLETTKAFLEITEENSKKELEKAILEAQATLQNAIDKIQEELENVKNGVEDTLDSTDPLLPENVFNLQELIEKAMAAFKSSDENVKSELATLINEATKALGDAAKELEEKIKDSFKPAEPTADQLLTEAKNALTLNVRETTENITLPTTGKNNAKITWTSNNAAISNTGVVTRPVYPAEDVRVTLTATLTLEGAKPLTKRFTVIVKATDATVEQLLAEAKEELTLNVRETTENITLPTTGKHNSTIIWASNNNALTNTGVVTRPAYPAEDVRVTLTATIKINGKEVTKEFTVIVKATEATVEQLLAEAKEALELNVSQTTENITLPNEGKNGASISWSSSNTDVIANNGTVKQPTYTEGSKTVTLTATITISGKSVTKEFTIEVPAAAATNKELLEAAAKEFNFEVTETTENITLPTDAINNVIVTWSSNNTNVIKNDGTVIRPAYGTQDETVTLTATLKLGNETLEKEYQVTVKAIDTPTYITIAEAKTATKGDFVAIKGVVTAKGSESLLIQDETGAIMLYKASKESALFGEIMVGDVVTAEGTYTIYKGLHEVTDLTSLAIAEAGTAPTVKSLTAIDAATIESLQCQIVSIELTYVSGTVGAGQNATFKDVNETTITVRGDSNWGTVETMNLVPGTTVRVMGFVNWFNGAQLTNVPGYTFIEVLTVPSHTHTACPTCGGCTDPECDGAENVKCQGHQSSGEPVETTTVKVVIADYAAAKGWENNTQYPDIKINSLITVTAVGGGYAGKYYTSGNNWRLYQTDSSTLTIIAKEGCSIVSVKITYTVDKNGILTQNASNIASGTVVNVNASSIAFGVGNTGEATNGQVRITEIEVVYSGGSASVPTDAELLAEDKEALELDFSEVTENFTLPTLGSVNGSTISWASDNAAISIEDGAATVTRSNTDVPVKLTATLTKGEATDTVTFDVTVKAEEQEQPEVPGAPTVLATFELGANGSASHNDGTSIDSSKSYTDGAYTLALTSCSNVYDGARDANGNSCLKFGTSKKVGSMTFTVPENVTSVTIYVAQYKANATKVNINGTPYTVTTASNNGEYTAYTVDTTTTKTITFTTVSGGVRAMVNTIVFTGLEA